MFIGWIGVSYLERRFRCQGQGWLCSYSIFSIDTIPGVVNYQHSHWENPGLAIIFIYVSSNQRRTATVERAVDGNVHSTWLRWNERLSRPLLGLTLPGHVPLDHVAPPFLYIICTFSQEYHRISKPCLLDLRARAWIAAVTSGVRTITRALGPLHIEFNR